MSCVATAAFFNRIGQEQTFRAIVTEFCARAVALGCVTTLD